MKTNRDLSYHHETAPVAHLKSNAVITVVSNATMKENGLASAGPSRPPHQRKALADMSNSDPIQPNVFNISNADELLKPVVTKSNNLTAFYQQHLNRLQES